MRYVFADTVYWIALANPNDKHNAEAKRAESELGDATIVTTDGVFGEVLASLSEKLQLREGALQLFYSALDHPNMEVVRQHAGLFNRAIERYANQEDRTASLIDCISMEVMDDYKITDVLTTDTDFQRAGYARLMRNPNEP